MGSSFGLQTVFIMKSIFITSMVLFMALQFTTANPTPGKNYHDPYDISDEYYEDEGCACATRNGNPVQYEDSEGDLQGNCAIKAKVGPHKGKFFAMLKKNGPCECQSQSSRTRKYCVNYDLCDVNNPDAEFN